MAEIAVRKRQIRDEKKAKEPGSPQDVRSYRERRIFRTNHNRQRRKTPKLVSLGVASVCVPVQSNAVAFPPIVRYADRVSVRSR
jgi:hypothetical protein